MDLFIGVFFKCAQAISRSPKINNSSFYRPFVALCTNYQDFPVDIFNVQWIILFRFMTCRGAVSNKYY